MNNNYKWKPSGEKASVISIAIDVPSAFFNSSIAMSSKNSSICMGNLTQFNQTA